MDNRGSLRERLEKRKLESHDGLTIHDDENDQSLYEKQEEVKIILAQVKHKLNAKILTDTQKARLAQIANKLNIASKKGDIATIDAAISEVITAMNSTHTNNEVETRTDGKKKGGWLWVLLLLALITIAFYYNQTNIKQTLVNEDGHLLAKKENKNEIIASGQYVTHSANGTLFDMVEVVGGTFKMGAATSSFRAELNAHTVTLNNYFIGKTEVTQGLWEAVMGAKYPNTEPSTKYGKGINYPVYYIKWNDIVGTSGGVGYKINGVNYYKNGFCYKLSQLGGGDKKFRLPTEAEWEYSARGGNRTNSYNYSGSNNIGAVAWYLDNSNNKTNEVGKKAANELGIYDMSGNVTEWVSDWYGSYSSREQTSPIGPASGSDHPCRGGSFRLYSGNACVAYRGNQSPSNHCDNDIGFRLAYGADTKSENTNNEIVGVWKGRYSSSGKVTLTINDDMTGVFDFVNVKSGKYNVSVDYSNGKCRVTGTTWINRPSGYVFYDLNGSISDGVFSGVGFRIEKNKGMPDPTDPQNPTRITTTNDQTLSQVRLQTDTSQQVDIPVKVDDNTEKYNTAVKNAEIAFAKGNYDVAFKYYTEAGNYNSSIKSVSASKFRQKAQEFKNVLGEQDETVQKLQICADALSD